jgi:hypothetical protein
MKKKGEEMPSVLTVTRLVRGGLNLKLLLGCLFVVCAVTLSATVTAVSVANPMLSKQAQTVVTSPIFFSATAESDLRITGYVIYVDNHEVYRNFAPSLDAWVLLMPGTTHALFIKAWDSSGALLSTPTYVIKVVGAAAPNPPALATRLDNLDKPAMFAWEVDNDRNVGGECNDGSIGTFFSSNDPNTMNAPDPDENGQLFLVDSKCTYDDSLFFWKDPQASQIGHTNFLWDFWIYIPASTPSEGIQALEFDLFQAVRLSDGVHEFMFGSQCNYVSNRWQFWLPQNGRLGWVNSGLSPCRFSTGRWHHLTYFQQRVTSTGYQEIPETFNSTSDHNNYLRFGTLSVDGETLYMGGLANSTIPDPIWAPVLGVQHQLDSARSGVTIEEYVNKESLTSW